MRKAVYSTAPCNHVINRVIKMGLQNCTVDITSNIENEIVRKTRKKGKLGYEKINKSKQC